MIAKSLIAALALAAGLATALPAPEARADVDVDVAIGVGGYYPPAYDAYDAYGDYGYGHRRGHVERYRHYEPYYREEVILYVTCGEGRRILRREGFRDIEARNCRGPNYRYTAWKRGKRFDIRMSAAGEITRIRRVH